MLEPLSPPSSNLIYVRSTDTDTFIEERTGAVTARDGEDEEVKILLSSASLLVSSLFVLCAVTHKARRSPHSSTDTGK